ncbi:UNVERIFIED_CONTAM: Inositol transporter 4 [Sesamum radiatum]|uniref:Inositol transporter 4 n=1 Tax=Sesamum radiatum TaxID=300843 RepID=A0AAW2T226_SESRA
MKALQSSVEAEKADEEFMGNSFFAKLKGMWGNDVVRRGSMRVSLSKLLSNLLA